MNWKVVLEVRSPTGEAFPQGHTADGDTGEDAIDQVLEHVELFDHWNIIAAWAVPADTIVTVDVERRPNPTHRRRTA
jgi:hypothetical protein